MTPHASLAVRQKTFGRALLDPRIAIPQGLRSGRRGLGATRFNVYRNNGVMGQVLTLQEAFPVTARLVGEAFFHAMARAYVAIEPPQSPLMFDYGAGFAAFIATFPPAASLVYLPDVARFERAWVESYHAAEAFVPDTATLVAALAGDASCLSLTLHPSARWIASAFPVVSVWQANVDTARTVDLNEGAEAALIVRPHAEVEVYRLAPGGVEMLSAFAKGHTMEDAASHAFAVDPAFDLAAHLSLLFRARAIVALHDHADGSSGEPSP